MLIRMKISRDLFYPGELVTVDDVIAREWIAAGLAEAAMCPDCGGQLEDAGCAVYCDQCGLRRWKGSSK